MVMKKGSGEPCQVDQNSGSILEIFLLGRKNWKGAHSHMLLNEGPERRVNIISPFD